MKHCPTCGTKPLTDFAVSKGKPRAHCKLCEYAKRRESRKDKREGAMRTCVTCKKTKPMGHYEFCESGRHALKCTACKPPAKASKKIKPYYPEPVHGTNPFDWRNYKSSINWNDNARYIPDTAGSKSFWI